MFKDRKDAGQKLALALEAYKDQAAIVLAIPRGGVEVGYYVARYLNADFSIIIARKLPFPDNPEAGFGAIAEDGSTFIIDYFLGALPPHTIERIKHRQQQEIKRRIAALRKDNPLPDLAGRTVILVDDGIAMGSTMRSAIMFCRNKQAAKIVVASPVTGPATARQLANLVDELVILEKPSFFRAVADIYENWYDVPDAEVIRLMEKWHSRNDGHTAEEL
jgi:predicted phosphoribosyltransferase